MCVSILSLYLWTYPRLWESVFFFFKDLFFIYMGVLLACSTVHCLCSTCRGQEGVMDVMALELQMVVNCPIGCWESNPGVFWRAASALMLPEGPPFLSFLPLWDWIQHKPQRGKLCSEHSSSLGMAWLVTWFGRFIFLSFDLLSKHGKQASHSILYKVAVDKKLLSRLDFHWGQGLNFWDDAGLR